MAGDFTQEQSLTRHCQKTCHLLQTCQLTRMQLGIEADQFPDCQPDMALIVAFCEVKKNQVQLVWMCLDILSTLCLQPGPAASQDTKERISNYSVRRMLSETFTTAKLAGCTRVAHVWFQADASATGDLSGHRFDCEIGHSKPSAPQSSFLLCFVTTTVSILHTQSPIAASAPRSCLYIPRL